MTGAPRPDVTLLPERAGDERARGDLIAQVYDELRRVAVGLMRREHPGHTLSPTAVVHATVIRPLGGAELGGRASDDTGTAASDRRTLRRRAPA